MTKLYLTHDFLKFFTFVPFVRLWDAFTSFFPDWRRWPSGRRFISSCSPNGAAAAAVKRTSLQDCILRVRTNNLPKQTSSMSLQPQDAAKVSRGPIDKTKRVGCSAQNRSCEHIFGKVGTTHPHDKKGVKYAIVIYKSLGPPDPTHPHLELCPK